MHIKVPPSNISDIELQQAVQIMQSIPSDTIVDQLNQYYENENLVNAFRSQNRLISTLSGFSQKEIEDNFYNQLGIPKGTPREEFLEIVKEKTKPYFNK